MPGQSVPPETAPSEGQRRRKRTNAYLSMWAIQADVSTLAVPLSSTIALPNIAAVVGRAKALCLCSLKGQGLTQHEVFAFADAYEVWDHLSLVENDYVLDPNPEDGVDRNFAWRSEGLWVLLWAVNLVRHLGFPDHAAEPAEAVRLCVEELCARTGAAVSLRPPKDVLDGADVATCLDAVAHAVAATGETPPSGMHPGVVYERQLAFAWLVSVPRSL